MFKNMSIRKRIVVILAIVYVVSFAVAVGVGYWVLRQDTIRESEEKATILLASMKASRGYLKEVLRPRLQQLLPGQFVLEGMSGTFLSTGIAAFVKKKHPDYIYKVASPNPLNPKNLTDYFENTVIGLFKTGGATEWRGFVERAGKRFYAVATPVVAEAKCLKCHGVPEDTYPILKVRYGTESGYGYKVGEIVGGLFVYVPAEIAINQAIKKLIYFSAGFSVFFLIVLIVVDRIIVRSVVQPIERFVGIAEEISRGHMEKEFEVTTNDEMKTLADAFTRMKRSLARAIEMLKSR